MPGHRRWVLRQGVWVDTMKGQTGPSGPALPTAAFTAAPSSGTAPLTVVFTNASTGASAYGWDFGDGTTSTATSPSHTFTTTGSRVVTLTATNSAGTSTATRTIVVGTSALPNAVFTASPTSGASPFLVQFTNTSTAATSYSWNFGDGTAASTTTSPQHTYSTAGQFTVTLTATNASGSDTATATISATAAVTKFWLGASVHYALSPLSKFDQFADFDNAAAAVMGKTGPYLSAFHTFQGVSPVPSTFNGLTGAGCIANGWPVLVQNLNPVGTLSGLGDPNRFSTGRWDSALAGICATVPAGCQALYLVIQHEPENNYTAAGTGGQQMDAWVEDFAWAARVVEQQGNVKVKASAAPMGTDLSPVGSIGGSWNTNLLGKLAAALAANVPNWQNRVVWGPDQYCRILGLDSTGHYEDPRVTKPWVFRDAYRAGFRRFALTEHAYGGEYFDPLLFDGVARAYRDYVPGWVTTAPYALNEYMCQFDSDGTGTAEGNYFLRNDTTGPLYMINEWIKALAPLAKPNPNTP